MKPLRRLRVWAADAGDALGRVPAQAVSLLALAASLYCSTCGPEPAANYVSAGLCGAVALVAYTGARDWRDVLSLLTADGDEG